MRPAEVRAAGDRVRDAGRCPVAERQAPSFHPCCRCLAGRALAARLMRRGWTPPAPLQPATLLEPAQREGAAGGTARGPPASRSRASGSTMREALLSLPEDRGEPVDQG
jgi:hypothetical protein